jgi:coproporphyrinogen III oxidase
MMERIVRLGLLLASLQTSTVGAWSLSQYNSKLPDASGRTSALTSDDFDNFVSFLLERQKGIIQQLEELEISCQSDAKFCLDPWGVFAATGGDGGSEVGGSGGLTRVLQNGAVIEKGACSLTLIQQGVLSSERAKTIRERQSTNVRAGDHYSAAALSMVLHTRSPLIPTFRSDVRIFMVHPSSETRGHWGDAWFGGGADLTPYYLNDEDITGFHACYRDLCSTHFSGEESIGGSRNFSYDAMKKACDDYFYLPARCEHRGTGGIFFDDIELNADSLAFTMGVVDTWMDSWIPIANRHKNTPFTKDEKQWQLLRRGRYLEFNLLYDRGVKFGLAAENPRVEGVMVSAPPLIAFEYNNRIDPGSRESLLLKVLKDPKEWV